MTAPAVAQPLVPPRPRSEIARRVVVYVLLALVSLLFFVPFIWSISTSFKTLPDTQNFNFIPHPFTTQAWTTVWTQYDFKRYIANSLFLAVVITAVNALARSRSSLFPAVAWSAKVLNVSFRGTSFSGRRKRDGSSPSGG